MDSGIVKLCENAHQIMENFTQELENNPLQVASISLDSLTQTLNAVYTATTEVDDPRPLEDAVLMLKCFAATIFYPADDFGSRVAIFLDWVHSALNVLFDLDTEINETPVLDWELVYRCLLAGKFSSASRMVLELGDNELFGEVAALLNHYPVSTKYYSTFMAWRKSALALQTRVKNDTSGGVGSTGRLHVLLGILVGDINLIQTSSPHWIYAVCGTFIYGDPSPNLFQEIYTNLSPNLKIECVDSSFNDIATWEVGCKHIFESKIVMALRDLETLNITASLLISELCGARGVLDSYTTNINDKWGVRETLALRYIRFLFQCENLVPTGLELIENLGTEGAKELANDQFMSLVHVYPDTSQLCIDVAHNLELKGLKKELCVYYANYRLKYGGYVAALDYFYEAGDYRDVNLSAKQFFERVLVTQTTDFCDSETEDLSRVGQNLHEVDLPEYVKSCLSPVMVLIKFLDAREVNDTDVLSSCLGGLLSCSKHYLEYLPLLIVLATTTTSKIVTTRNIVMLIDALDLWDKSSMDVKSASQRCISAAIEANPSWTELFPFSTSSDELVWKLRKQLAKDSVF